MDTYNPKISSLEDIKIEKQKLKETNKQLVANAIANVYEIPFSFKNTLRKGIFNYGKEILLSAALLLLKKKLFKKSR